MINFILGSNLQELNDPVKQIYIDSFPADERREWPELNQVLHNSIFSLTPIMKQQKIIGLISTWNLHDLLFIEHFAIEKTFQGKGLGSQVLTRIIHAKSVRVVVEVEPPTNELSQRRITFYERLGFSTCEITYWQPPYSPDKIKVKMLLMSFPDKVQPLEFMKIKTQLYTNVYQWKDSHGCHYKL